MASGAILHFTNDSGVREIRISVRHFNCIGARPPLDHPHIYLQMPEKQSEMVCPYCSTRYIYDAALTQLADPPEALYEK